MTCRSVNFKFVHEEVFVSKPFAITLLVVHLGLLFLFAQYKWCKYAMLLNPSIQLSLMFMGLVTSFPWIKFSCYVLDEGTMSSCSWQTWRRDCCSIRACTLKQGWWKAEQSWLLFCHKCKQDTAGPSSRPYPCPISTLMLDFSCTESGDLILEKAIKCPLQCKLWLLFRYCQCSFYRELYWNCLCTFSSLSVLLMVSWNTMFCTHELGPNVNSISWLSQNGCM